MAHRDDNDNLWGLLLFAFLAAGVYAWVEHWVLPRDAFLGEVMDCTRDGSRAEYDRCAAEVSARHRAGK